jgi:DNA-binding transcriptional MocR family regulator
MMAAFAADFRDGVDHHVAEQVERVNRGYREKARAVKGWLQEKLGDELADLRGGSAGFYFYLTFRSVETHEASPFFGFLARTTGIEEIDGPPQARHARVIYIPGEFCVHPRGELVAAGRRQLRLSYGFEELDRIAEAIGCMRKAATLARQAKGEHRSG